MTEELLQHATENTHINDHTSEKSRVSQCFTL